MAIWDSRPPSAATWGCGSATTSSTTTGPCRASAPRTHPPRCRSSCSSGAATEPGNGIQGPTDGDSSPLLARFLLKQQEGVPFKAPLRRRRQAMRKLLVPVLLLSVVLLVAAAPVH